MKKIFLMRAVRLSFLIFFLTLGFFVILPLKTLSATTPVINEFSSDTAGTTADPDWVEIYNNGSDPVDLSLYRIRDSSATNKLDLGGILSPNDSIAFDWFNRLDKLGDEIKLLLISNEETPIDKIAYGNKGDIIVPSVGQSAGRTLDGQDSWSIFSTPTKGKTNNISSPVPTLAPTSIPTNTPVPTKAPTPTKASTSKTATKIADATVIKPTSIPTVFQVTKAQVSNYKAVLGDKNQPTIRLTDEKTISTPTPSIKNENITKEIKTLGARQNNLPKILIGVGVILVILCGILFGRSFRKKILDEKNE